MSIKPIFEDVQDRPNPEEFARMESKESSNDDAVKAPKLVKPLVKTEPELVELYQAELLCW